MVYDIEVAEVAAIINVAIVLVKFTYPLLVTLLAVGTVKKGVNAATWNVFGRLVNDSLWRVLLRTDTASSRKVDTRTRLLSVFSTFLGVLLAIAAAITPLGLHETYRLKNAEGTAFGYVKDGSSVGRATPARYRYSTNRACGFVTNEACPGNLDRPEQDGISTSVTSNITDVFTSATRGAKSTIASVFDIQYRFYIDYNNATKPEGAAIGQWLDQGRPRTQGRFRFSEDFVANPRLQAVEGLIVSTAEDPGPGIGIRNHTLPMESLKYGYVWEEDLLWLEPVTECTNLNVTYDFTMPSDSTAGIPTARITDRGGFANLYKGYPYIDVNDTQTDPLLLLRSWKAATLTDNILMQYLNETRNMTRIGKSYSLDRPEIFLQNFDINPRKIALSPFGSLDDNPKVFKPSLPAPLTTVETDPTSFNYSAGMLDEFELDTVIKFGGADVVNISTSGATGGLILGVGTQVDGSGNPIDSPDDVDRFDPGTNWTQPLYACVSAVKASIKTARFQLNGTASLSNLVVESVRPSNDTNRLWGMENPGMTLGQISPFWGLVSEDQASNPNIATLRRDHFYLPAGSSSVLSTTVTGYDGAAGAKAPNAVFNSIYNSMAEGSFPDLSGNGNWPLAEKWAMLGADAGTVGGIPNYLWVDLMANAVVGSKSVLSQPDGSPDVERAILPASYYQRSVGYDWKYAIPALLFAAIYLISLASSVALVAIRRIGFGTITMMLNESSAGRAFTNERFQAITEADRGSNKEWAETRGDERPLLAGWSSAYGGNGMRRHYDPVFNEGKQGPEIRVQNA